MIMPAIFTVLSFLGTLGLVIFIRWINDARFAGWRRRRWEERTTPKREREWKPWFAWRPVRTVSDELIWWATVYRQLGNDYADQEDWNWYYYGSVFDALKDQ